MNRIGFCTIFNAVIFEYLSSISIACNTNTKAYVPAVIKLWKERRDASLSSIVTQEINISTVNLESLNAQQLRQKHILFTFLHDQKERQRSLCM